MARRGRSLGKHILSAQGVLLKGPDVGSSDPGPRGPKLKNPIFNLFWAPGDIPNRCALKFHANHSYFHNFWWHGMKILIFGCKCTLGYPGAPGDGGSVYMLALDIRQVTAPMSLVTALLSQVMALLSQVMALISQLSIYTE